jgi:hypothetical protein
VSRPGRYDAHRAIRLARVAVGLIFVGIPRVGDLPRLRVQRQYMMSPFCGVTRNRHSSTISDTQVAGEVDRRAAWRAVCGGPAGGTAPALRVGRGGTKKKTATTANDVNFTVDFTVLHHPPGQT